MRVVRVPLALVSEGEHRLSTEKARYVSRVLRLGPGARFVAFDAATRTEADAELLEEEGHVRIGPPRPASVVARAELVVVYALAKGDKVDATVRDATELGATRIVLAAAKRSIAKVADREATKLDRWRRIAEQAARQCGRSDPPEIEGVHRWPDALDAAASCDARFCLDPGAATPLGPELAGAAAAGASIAFAIGPEGGLAPEEIALAATKGFVPSSLGPFVLRTETVAAAVLGAVRVLAGA